MATQGRESFGERYYGGRSPDEEAERPPLEYRDGGRRARPHGGDPGQGSAPHEPRRRRIIVEGARMRPGGARPGSTDDLFGGRIRP